MSDIIPVFVYGTLQPGEPLYSLIEPAVLYPPCEGAQTHGQLFHVSNSLRPAFPVADFEREGFIVGTLLLVRANARQWESTWRMEEDAGYERRMVRLTLPHFDKSVEAVSFHWPHEDRGPLIPHGDWTLEMELLDR